MKKTFLLLSFLTLSILVIAQTPEENLKSFEFQVGTLAVKPHLIESLIA